MSEKLILTRNEARTLDHCAIETFGIPSIVLMENAGRGIMDYLLTQEVKGKVVICCGKGNNGGDGLVVARHLDNQGVSVHVLLFSNPEALSSDAAINYHIIVQSKILHTIIQNQDYHEIMKEADWIIDGLFGTGLTGIVKYPFDKIIQTMNESKAKILSIDIPSGLDCDTGEPLGIAVQARHTVTFVGNKKGFLKEKAKKYLGQIAIIDIGIPKLLLNDYHRRS